MAGFWLLLAVLGLYALVRLGRAGEGRGAGHWRISTSLFALALIGGGGIVSARGQWPIGIVMVGAGLYLLTASRTGRQVPMRSEALSESEARDILGVGERASEAEIQAAWRRLIATAHPDRGGTKGLAEKVNAARARLLRR